MVLEGSPPLVTLKGVVTIPCEWYARNNAMHTFMYRINPSLDIFNKSHPGIERLAWEYRKNHPGICDRRWE